MTHIRGPHQTRTATARASRRARLVILVAAVATLLAGWSYKHPVKANAAATPSPNAEAPIAINLETLEPKVVRPGDTLQLAGTMKNTSSDPLTSVSISLRVSQQRITTRYDLARQSDPATQIGFVLSSTRQRFGTVEPGTTVYWSMSVPVRGIGLPTSPSMFGAYPLAIEATATRDRSTEHARLPTTLMWMPEGAQLTPTKVSWLWPLIDGVHRGMGDTFFDDDLAKDLAPNGRIGKLTSIAADANLPLTYVVDPALVDDAAAMAATAPASSGGASSSSPKPSPVTPEVPSVAAPSAKSATPTPSRTEAKQQDRSPSASAPPAPYRVQDSDATTPGTGATVAAGWLAELKALVTKPGSALMGVPYGDPDLVALERAGLRKEITITRSTGQSTLLAHLAPPSLPGVVWPVDNVLDEPTLDDLSSDLVTTVVLSDSVLAPRDPDALAGPRTDLQTASGTVSVVLTDSTIDALIANPDAVTGGPRVAEQRFLAETMLITEQRPGAGSSLVLAPPRNADPSNPYLRAMLTDTGMAPWLHMVDLGVIAAQPSDDIARQPISYPAKARDKELPQNTLAPIAALRDGLSRFTAVLDTGTSEPFLASANLAIVRAESSWWRANPARTSQIVSAVQASLEARTDKVVVSNPQLITLTSRKQKVPLTIVNNLPEPVTVQLRLSAVNPARLKVTPTPPFTIDGKGGRHEVLVEVEATTNGRFDVQAQLMTPETVARPFGKAVSFEVNSTAYGAVALAIAGSAAGLLFLLSGIRIFRRVRRGKRDGDAAPSTPDPADPADPADLSTTS